MGKKFATLTVFALGTAWLFMPLTAAVAETRNVEPEADAVFKKMCDYLQKQQAFRVEAETSYQSVLDNGQKLMFLNQVTLKIKRPDRLYSYRKGMLRNQEIFYDGKTITLYSRGVNLWASSPAPGNLTETLNFAVSELGLNAPGGDLFTADVYDAMMTDILSGVYIGKTVVNGVPCHHLAYRGAEVDWQIWIQEGETPLPRKYVITSKWTTASPEYSITIRMFDSAGDISDDEFHFTPPEGSARIEFASRVEAGLTENK